MNNGNSMVFLLDEPLMARLSFCVIYLKEQDKKGPSVKRLLNFYILHIRF